MALGVERSALRCTRPRITSAAVPAVACSRHAAAATSSPPRAAPADTPRPIEAPRLLGLATAVVGLSSLLLPEPALSAEALSGSAFSAFTGFLDYVQSLGAAGPLVFAATVAVMEMVPLFPTQPLLIASGLLFGPVKGSATVLVGVSLAALNAFLISRGVGRKLAEKVIVMEMSEDHGPVQAKLLEVQHAIRSGGPMQQLTAVLLLRLTPVVPFSASNYVLGLTPVQLPAYLGGTVIGMSVWSVLFASAGAASRELLEGGMDMATLMADLSEKVSKYSSTALTAALGLGVVAGVVFVIRRQATQAGKVDGKLQASVSDGNDVQGSVSSEKAAVLQEAIEK